ncbi:MAG TPA: TolC family protein [Verrucomicrobiales bacterium]|nr:TolC family protein [Verrucomicrobiales bacterium]
MAAAAGCTLLLSGCKIPTPPGNTDVMDPHLAGQIPENWKTPAARSHPDNDWVSSFRDSKLNRLVAAALAHNPSLGVAEANVDASRAAVRIAGARLYPWVAAKGLVERQGLELDGAVDRGIDAPNIGSIGGGLGVDTGSSSPGSRSVDKSSRSWVYGLGTAAAWEPDLWGRVRSGRAAAVEGSYAAEADYYGAQQLIAAQTAKAWFAAIEAAELMALAQDGVKAYGDLYSLSKDRKEQGAASDLDLAQVKARVDSGNDLLLAARAASIQAVRAVEALTGNYPKGVLTTGGFPSFPSRVPAGLPSQLLERRPDIIASERRFAAAFHKTTEARTARLPRFSLSVSGGLGSNHLDSVGTLDGVMWNFASGLTQPIFLGGQLKAMEDLRKAEQKGAAAAYTGVVLRAFQEVETSLALDPVLREREAVLTSQVKSTTEAESLSRVNFDVGKSSMFEVLELYGRSLAARAELIRFKSHRLAERVNLHLALGGGFRAVQK